jgi:K+-transporting ATPase ATPase A chain
MTANGWIQIALFSVIIIALTPVLGAYMTKVFSGDRTFLSFLLRPIERAIYTICGVHEKDEQHWTGYGVSMLLFNLAGFFLFYAIERFQGILPFNPQGLGALSGHLSFNTAISFITNTNWQSYVP